MQELMEKEWLREERKQKNGYKHTCKECNRGGERIGSVSEVVWSSCGALCAQLCASTGPS